MAARVARGAAWLALVVVAAAWLAQPASVWTPGASAAATLQISGDVENLTPGVPSPLQLTVSNPAGTPFVVRRVDVAVLDGGSPACSAADLAVSPWEGRVQMEAGRTATMTVVISVPHKASCEGQRWSLRYSAA